MRRSEEQPGPDRLDTSEYFQQLIDNPSVPQPKARLCNMSSRSSHVWLRLEHRLRNGAAGVGGSIQHVWFHLAVVAEQVERPGDAHSCKEVGGQYDTSFLAVIVAGQGVPVLHQVPMAQPSSSSRRPGAFDSGNAGGVGLPDALQ